MLPSVDKVMSDCCVCGPDGLWAKWAYYWAWAFASFAAKSYYRVYLILSEAFWADLLLYSDSKTELSYKSGQSVDCCQFVRQDKLFLPSMVYTFPLFVKTPLPLSGDNKGFCP